jgi:hypothetical protein
MDFTINTYKKLLDRLLKAGYVFQTFSEFIEKQEDRVILLRHDVDAKKMNSLHFAKIQHEPGIKGTYYFRMVPQSFDEEVIKEIANLGHEIGYHYEDMDFASSRFEVRGSPKGMPMAELKEEDLYEVAIEIFQENLEKLRKLYPVKTICMHGSPRSPFDNKALWKKYNYRDYGIIGEPYFDIDFGEVFYLTDTGRMWDGEKVSIRDKVRSSQFTAPGRENNNISGENQEPVTRTPHPAPRTPHPATRTPHPAPRNIFPKYHTTHEIIRAVANNELPHKIMFTFHPQRWTNKPIPWLWELLFQNVKNQVKKYYLKKN